MKTYDMKNVVFPDCYEECEIAVKNLGCGECESICPWKFDIEGNPYLNKEQLIENQILKGKLNDK